MTVFALECADCPLEDVRGYESTARQRADAHLAAFPSHDATLEEVSRL